MKRFNQLTQDILILIAFICGFGICIGIGI